MDQICVAVIVGAYGVKGQVRLKTWTSDPHSLLEYQSLQSDKGQTFELKTGRVTGPEGVIATLKGINDRNQAEALKGTLLYILRDELPVLEEEDTFYYADLVGLKVKTLVGDSAPTEQEVVGKIIALHNFGAGDLLEIKPQEGSAFLVPFTKEFVPVVKVSEGWVGVAADFVQSMTVPHEAPEKTTKPKDS